MVGRGGSGEEGLYEWFVAARGGGREALNHLLDDLRPIILRNVRDRVRSGVASRAVAEELTQDVLLRVAEGIAGCRARSEAQLRAWCDTIARRVVIDWYRHYSNENERRTAGFQGGLHGRQIGVPGEERAANTGSMIASDVESALGRILFDAQHVLSEGTRQVLRRRLLYNETWREVAEVVGTSPGGAKRRYQRAQARLRSEVLARIRVEPDRRLRRQLLRLVGGCEL